MFKLLYSFYTANSRKVLLVVFLIFICIAGISLFRTDKHCDLEHAKALNVIQQLRSDSSIREIVLFKAFPGWETNLVNDSIFIRNTSTIDTLRDMLLNREIGNWNHPVPVWNVSMKIVMANGSYATWQISRIGNDNKKEMTHIYTGSGPCYDYLPRYSLSLGDYLERITEYSGVNYK